MISFSSFLTEKLSSSSSVENPIVGHKKRIPDDHIIRYPGHLRKHYNKKHYNDNELNAMQEYSTDSQSLNRGLHSGGRLSQNDSYIHKHLQTAIHRVKTPHHMVVYSGLKYSPEIRGNIEPHGSVYHHKAYLSASLNHTVATGFSGETYEEQENGDVHVHRHVLKIHVPKGHPGIYMEDHSMNPFEHEMLLPPGTRLKIHSHPKVHLGSVYDKKGPFDSISNPKKQKTFYHFWNTKVLPHKEDKEGK